MIELPLVVLRFGVDILIRMDSKMKIKLDTFFALLALINLIILLLTGELDNRKKRFEASQHQILESWNDVESFKVKRNKDE